MRTNGEVRGKQTFPEGEAGTGGAEAPWACPGTDGWAPSLFSLSFLRPGKAYKASFLREAHLSRAGSS